VGAGFAIGLPVGEFKDNVDEIAGGIGVVWTVRIPNTPVHIGASGSYMSQGSVTEERDIIGAFDAEITTENKVFSLHAVLRLQNTGSKLRPYLDGLIGGKRFYTTTELDVGDEASATETDFDDFTMSYGLGGGVMYEIWRGEAGEHGETALFIDVGARYLIGGRADYVKIDSVDIAGDRIIFDTTSSRTDMVTFNIGVSALF
jgi:opacity protein-like surface antigen